MSTAVCSLREVALVPVCFRAGRQNWFVISYNGSMKAATHRNQSSLTGWDSTAWPIFRPLLCYQFVSILSWERKPVWIVSRKPLVVCLVLPAQWFFKLTMITFEWRLFRQTKQMLCRQRTSFCFGYSFCLCLLLSWCIQILYETSTCLLSPRTDWITELQYKVRIPHYL